MKYKHQTVHSVSKGNIWEKGIVFFLFKNFILLLYMCSLYLSGVKEVTVDTFDANESGDAETIISLTPKPETVKKKAKIVKF